MQYDSNLEVPIDRLNRVCALAAVRILYLPPSNPVTSCVRAAQQRHRQTHKSPLDHLFAGNVLPFPPIDTVQHVPVPLHRLWHQPRHIASIAEGENAGELSISEHDAIVARVDPRAVIYTDGSAIDGGVGAATLFGPINVQPVDPDQPDIADDNVIHIHLGTDSTHHNYTAELVALRSAVSYAPRLPDVYIFSDAKSGIQALGTSPARKADALVLYEIYRVMSVRQHETTFHLHWIKAHADIPGNE